MDLATSILTQFGLVRAEADRLVVAGNVVPAALRLERVTLMGPESQPIEVYVYREAEASEE